MKGMEPRMPGMEQSNWHKLLERGKNLEDWNIFARRSVQKIRADELKGREVLKMQQCKKNGNGKQSLGNKSCKPRERTTVEKQSRSKARWK